tara:strand:- start:95 stop:1042 length:948 start_codon:yes stop_codon:yes gene_type:complete
MKLKKMNSIMSLSDLKDPLEESKEKFVNLIKKRKIKLVINSNVLDLRCDTYRKYFDGVNIFIIFIGSLLTVLEAWKSIFRTSESENYYTRKGFDISPIILSTFLTFLAGILKFYKYQEKMEAINRCVEKNAIIISELEDLKEKAKFCKKPEDLQQLHKKYVDDIYKKYQLCFQEIYSNIKYKSLVEQIKKLHVISIQHSKTQSYFEANNKIALHEYKKFCEDIAKQKIDDKQYLPLNCLSEITRQESLCDKITSFFALFSCCKCFKKNNHDDSDTNSDTSHNSRESITNFEIPEINNNKENNDDEEKSKEDDAQV